MSKTGHDPHYQDRVKAQTLAWAQGRTTIEAAADYIISLAHLRRAVGDREPLHRRTLIGIIDRVARDAVSTARREEAAKEATETCVVCQGSRYIWKCDGYKYSWQEPCPNCRPLHRPAKEAPELPEGEVEGLIKRAEKRARLYAYYSGQPEESYLEWKFAAALARQKGEIAAYRKAYGCIACGEDHPEGTMCPPFEVRTTGMSWSLGRLSNAVARAERAEANLASESAAREKAEYERDRWKHVRKNAPDWEKLWEEEVEKRKAAESRADALKRAVEEIGAKAHRLKWDYEDCGCSAFETLRVLGDQALTADKGEGPQYGPNETQVRERVRAGEISDAAAGVALGFAVQQDKDAAPSPEGHSAGEGKAQITAERMRDKAELAAFKLSFQEAGYPQSWEEICRAFAKAIRSIPLTEEK